MAIVTGRYWECDVCGYRWPYIDGVMPDQCRSLKCRSRKFNSGAVVQRVEPSTAGLAPVVAHEKVVRVDPAPPSTCSHKGHFGYYRGDGYWCVTCGRLY